MKIPDPPRNRLDISATRSPQMPDTPTMTCTEGQTDGFTSQSNHGKKVRCLHNSMSAPEHWSSLISSIQIACGDKKQPQPYSPQMSQPSLPHTNIYRDGSYSALRDAVHVGTIPGLFALHLPSRSRCRCRSRRAAWILIFYACPVHLGPLPLLAREPHLVSRLHQVGNAGLHACMPSAADHERVFGVCLQQVAQATLDFVHDLQQGADNQASTQKKTVYLPPPEHIVSFDAVWAGTAPKENAVTFKNGGCMWPSSGKVWAASTRGWAFAGPGPMSRRAAHKQGQEDQNEEHLWPCWCRAGCPSASNSMNTQALHANLLGTLMMPLGPRLASLMACTGCRCMTKHRQGISAYVEYTNWRWEMGSVLASIEARHTANTFSCC
eukprot:1159398-Pelagomonas_calceolata.AAC.6